LSALVRAGPSSRFRWRRTHKAFQMASSTVLLLAAKPQDLSVRWSAAPLAA
jgi:hypothetical protein